MGFAVAFILLNDAIIKWQRLVTAIVELTKYSWWGDFNELPEKLKTKKQLGEFGLYSLKPSGVIPTRKYNVFLYDSTNPESCRPK